jgi:hypothetical protein
VDDVIADTCCHLDPNNLKMRFQREIKGLEARQRLEALVIPKRQALTRLQALLAPSAGSCCTVLYWFSKAALNHNHASTLCTQPKMRGDADEFA